MIKASKIKKCANHKSIERDLGSSFKNNLQHDCSDCVYFSSRNCGMDAADSIEPELGML